MTWLLCIPLIAYMSFMARASGADWAHKVWSRLPEILFVLPFAIASYFLYDSPLLASIGFFVSYFSMEMGHGTFWNMTGYSSSTPGRIQSIEYVVRPIFKLFNMSIEQPAYSWVCMGLKGLLIASPLGLYALPMLILWPLSYYLGMRVIKKSEYSEWISGGFSAILITTAFVISKLIE